MVIANKRKSYPKNRKPRPYRIFILTKYIVKEWGNENKTNKL